MLTELDLRSTHGGFDNRYDPFHTSRTLSFESLAHNRLRTCVALVLVDPDRE